MSDKNTLAGKQVLICDDDFDFRLSCRIQFESVGCCVIEAESGAQAEEILRTQKPDLALVDLMMENDDTGFSLCYHMKKRYPELPVIMVTGAASETGFEFDSVTQEERLWIKADVVLNKPIRFEQLQRESERLLAC